MAFLSEISAWPLLELFAPLNGVGAFDARGGNTAFFVVVLVVVDDELLENGLDAMSAIGGKSDVEDAAATVASTGLRILISWALVVCSGVVPKECSAFLAAPSESTFFTLLGRERDIALSFAWSTPVLSSHSDLPLAKLVGDTNRDRGWLGLDEGVVITVPTLN